LIKELSKGTTTAISDLRKELATMNVLKEPENKEPPADILSIQMDTMSQANPEQAMKMKNIDSAPMEIPEDESIGEFVPSEHKKKEKKPKKHKTGRVP